MHVQVNDYANKTHRLGMLHAREDAGELRTFDDRKLPVLKGHRK